MRKKTKHRLIILVVAVIALFGVLILKSKDKAKVAPPAPTIEMQVPVLARDVHANQLLYDGDWHWAAKDVIEEDKDAYIDFANEGDKAMAHVQVIRAKRKGDILQKIDVVAVESDPKYSSRLAKGFSAFALSAKQLDNALLAYITEGDWVDVIWYQPEIGEKIRLLSHRRVLFASKSVVILALPMQEAQMLSVAQNVGKIEILLRSAERTAWDDLQPDWESPKDLVERLTGKSAHVPSTIYHVRGTEVTHDTINFQVPSS